MHRCFVDPADWSGNVFRLSPEETHHLQSVLRAKPGEKVFVFDGAGRSGMATLTDWTPDDSCRQHMRARLELQDEWTVPEPDVGLVLIQCLPKGKRMDLVVEKATELGATRVLPVVSSRTVTRVGGKQAAERRERWQRIARGAGKQCGADWIPVVEPVVSLADALSRLSTLDLFLVGSLSADAVPLPAALSTRSGLQKGQVGLLIGPEGDLTREEIAAAREVGGMEVGFSCNVLRTETAAMYGLSVLSYVFRRG